MCFYQEVKVGENDVITVTDSDKEECTVVGSPASGANVVPAVVSTAVTNLVSPSSFSFRPCIHAWVRFIAFGGAVASFALLNGRKILEYRLNLDQSLCCDNTRCCRTVVVRHYQ